MIMLHDIVISIVCEKILKKIKKSMKLQNQLSDGWQSCVFWYRFGMIREHKSLPSEVAQQDAIALLYKASYEPADLKAWKYLFSKCHVYQFWDKQLINYLTIIESLQYLQARGPPYPGWRKRQESKRFAICVGFNRGRDERIFVRLLLINKRSIL